MPRVRKAASTIKHTLTTKQKEAIPQEPTTTTQTKDSQDWLTLLSQLPEQPSTISTGLQNIRITTRSHSNKLQQNKQLVRKLFTAESVSKTQRRTNMSDSEGDQGAFANQTYVKPARAVGAKLPKNTHPPYLQMIQESLTELEERGKGVSRTKIITHIKEKYTLQDINNLALNRAMKGAIEKNIILNSTGTGLTGSFKLTKEYKEEKKQVAKVLSKQKESKSKLKAKEKVPKEKEAVTKETKKPSSKASKEKENEAPKSAKGRKPRAKSSKSEQDEEQVVDKKKVNKRPPSGKDTASKKGRSKDTSDKPTVSEKKTLKDKIEKMKTIKKTKSTGQLTNKKQGDVAQAQEESDEEEESEQEEESESEERNGNGSGTEEEKNGSGSEEEKEVQPALKKRGGGRGGKATKQKEQEELANSENEEENSESEIESEPEPVKSVPKKRGGGRGGKAAVQKEQEKEQQTESENEEKTGSESEPEPEPVKPAPKKRGRKPKKLKRMFLIGRKRFGNSQQDKLWLSVNNLFHSLISKPKG